MPTATGAKRKARGSPDVPPPAKRAVNGRLSPDDNTPDGGVVEYDDESDITDDDFHAHDAMYIGTPGSLGEWQDTIQKVVRNVVAIRFCQTCSFDTDPALTSEATGFVVDSERGYVTKLSFFLTLPPFFLFGPVTQSLTDDSTPTGTS